MHIFTTFTMEIPRRMPQLIGLGFHHQRCTAPNSNTNTNAKLHILKQKRYSYGSSGSSTPLVVKNTSNMIKTNTKYFETPTLWQIPQLNGPDFCTALGEPQDDIVSEQVPEF